MAWQFKREESEFKELEEGKYRIMIVDAEMAVSKGGNDMLVLKFKVSGTDRNLWNYITFLDDRPEITNRMLTQFFDSFGIEDGNFDLRSYLGKVGGCQVKHELGTDGKTRAKISYFLSKKQQESLPPWKGEAPVFETPVEVEEDELPF